MRIGVEGDSDVGVTQALADDFHVLSSRQEDRGVGVAQVVKPDRRELRRFDKLQVRTAQHVRAEPSECVRQPLTASAEQEKVSLATASCSAQRMIAAWAPYSPSSALSKTLRQVAVGFEPGLDRLLKDVLQCVRADALQLPFQRGALECCGEIRSDLTADGRQGDPKMKAELGAKTRQSKRKGLAFHELQTAWRERMTPQESAALAGLELRIGGDAEPVDSNAAARAIDHAMSHVFERKSVVPERTLLATALKHGVGRATVEDIHREADAKEFIVGERHGRRMVTTRDVLAEEKRLIDFARRGRGTCKPFVKSYDDFQREWLNDEQKRAVRHVVESRDRVMLLRGAAGVGKTSLMQEAVEAIEASGTKVLAFAPSASASRGVLRDAGFGDADTVARFLVDEKLQQQAAGQLIWIDEAGQLGTKTMADVFQAADRIGARVLLSGDRRQHGSVERGAALRILEYEAGLRPAEVKEIRRQADAYKEAVKALSEGHTIEGFKRLNNLGWVREISDDARERQLVADYLETIGQGKTALVVSPTHAEGERITAEIRGAMRAAGALGDDEREFRTLTNANLTEAERGDAVNYQPGDELVFHQNAKGFTRGERLSAGGSRPLPLDHAARFQVFRSSTLSLSPGDMVRITQNGTTVDQKHRLNNGALYRLRRFDDDGNIVLDNGWVVGKDFGHLAHGYVVTSHASQGKTVDRVFVGQSSRSFPASSREQFYVSASRGRERVTIYTDDKEALRDAIEQSDERLSATEFVNRRYRGNGTLRELPRDLNMDRSDERKLEVSLEPTFRESCR